MIKGQIATLCVLVACASKDESTCATGYGRDSLDRCVAVGESEPAVSEPQDTSDTDQPEDTATPADDTPTWSPPDAVWSSAEVEAELGAFMAQGVPDPFTIFAGYQSMFAGADPGCPGGGPYEIAATAAGCVSELGWLYAGMASLREFEESIEQATVLSVDGYIISPDAGSFVGGGNVSLTLISEEGASAWLLQMIGTFGLDSSESPWLSQTPSLALTGSGGFMGDDYEASFVGGWQLGEQSIYMDIELGSACDGATGTVQFRDPSGAWHAVTLDCGQCGALSYAEGEAVGEVCVDLEPLGSLLDTLQAAR